MASARTVKVFDAFFSCIRNGPTASITRASAGSDARRCSTATPGSKPRALWSEPSAGRPPSPERAGEFATAATATTSSTASAAGLFVVSRTSRSIDNRRCFVLTPKAAEKPPSLPPAASTRWQGTTIANGFRPRACPTARAASRLPSRAAISPYESVAPTGMARAISVHATVEGGHAGHVEDDCGKVARSPAKKCGNPVDGPPHVSRRLQFTDVWKPAEHPRACGNVGRFGQLDANDPTVGPGDAASTYGRVEESNAGPHNPSDRITGRHR